MRSIGVFLPNWVGDVVMATPAIRAVREAYPAADLVAVCKPYVADTLAGAPAGCGQALRVVGLLPAGIAPPHLPGDVPVCDLRTTAP